MFFSLLLISEIEEKCTLKSKSLCLSLQWETCVAGYRWRLPFDLSLSNIRIYFLQNYNRGLNVIDRHCWCQCWKPTYASGAHLGLLGSGTRAGQGRGRDGSTGRGRGKGRNRAGQGTAGVARGLFSHAAALRLPACSLSRSSAQWPRAIALCVAKVPPGLQQTQHFCSIGKDLVDFKRMKYCRGIQTSKCIAPRSVPALSRILEACECSCRFGINPG